MSNNIKTRSARSVLDADCDPQNEQRQQAYVYQLNISRGGVPKLPISEAQVAEAGVVGDKQRNRRFHGGPNRAVSLYSFDLIQQLHEEGHPIAPGTTGENITVAGLDWAALNVGDQLFLGAEVVLQITSYAAPCAMIRESFNEGDFKRISQKVHPGMSRLYARVLTPGLLRVGDRVTMNQSIAKRRP